MRTKILLRVAVVLAATLAGVPDVGFGDSGAFGVTSAEARVYTRKRVNGRWITGRFVQKSKASKGRTVARGRRGKALALAAEPEAAVPLPQTRPEPSPTPMPVRSAAPAAPLVPLSTDERMLKLQEALQERAKSLARATTSEASLVDAGTSPNAMGSVGSPRPAAPEPRSLLLDFQTGLKTTVFTNGAVVEEKFDIGSLKGLAAASPNAVPAAAAQPQEAASSRTGSLQTGGPQGGSGSKNVQ